MKYFLARVPVLFYWCALLLRPFFAFGVRVSSRDRTKLCIEAGVEGWKIIEFKELYLSACEYLSEDQVFKVEVSDLKLRLKNLKDVFARERPTHYAYSPRTQGGGWGDVLSEAFSILWLVTRYNVTPIVFLTDFHQRRFRTKAYVITAFRGVVVTTVSISDQRLVVPHQRTIGPHVMPFSLKTYLEIERLVTKAGEGAEANQCTVVFSGSLYEPRKTILEDLRARLKQRGIDFQIYGRGNGGERVSDEVYWDRFVKADLIVTTSEQTTAKGLDFVDVEHMVYRYMEALVCGSVLVAPPVRGVDKFFRPGKDFISFSDVSEAEDRIYQACNDLELRQKVSTCGRARAKALLECGAFWARIDTGLGRMSLK